MSVRRVVANLLTPDPVASTAFYRAVGGLDVVMDHGWIRTLADPERPEVQLSLMTHDLTATRAPALSIDVGDAAAVDAAYAAAGRAGAVVVHPLTDEEWGVRRFFVLDPAGHVVNVLGHRTT